MRWVCLTKTISHHQSLNDSSNNDLHKCVGSKVNEAISSIHNIVLQTKTPCRSLPSIKGVCFGVVTRE